MASMGSPKTWIPYVNNKDCSAGFCSVYCPQWCYILFPPPPPPNSSQFPQDDDSSPNFSPLIIAIIGILASAFLLVSYYTIISKYCGNRNSSSSAARREENHHDPNAESDENHNHPSLHEPWHIATPGLDEALIRSITVCKYKRGDGLIDGTDCSVCLSEFHDGESVRLLPKCSHAFHVPCIDMWLRSHSNCPMCRAHIIFIGANSLPQPPPLVTAESPQGINESVQDSVANDQNVATAAAADNQEDAGRVAGEEQGILQPDEPPKTPFRVFSDLGSLDERNSVIDMIIRCEGNQPIWRSISMDHSPQTRVGRAPLAEILQTEQDEEVVVARMEEGWSGEASVEGTMSGQQRRKGVHCVLSPVAMKRSFSSGRFFLTRPGRVRDMSISPVRKN